MADGVKVEVRVKDTRAALVRHCEGRTWHFPGTLFPLTEEERANAAARTSRWVVGSAGSVDGVDPGEGGGDPDGFGEPELDSQAEHEPDSYPVAAE